MSTVLFVGNNPAVRDSVKEPIAGCYEILEAACPVEALDICRTHREVDVLVCDAELGLVSGMELASLLRAWLPKLRTVLLSAVPCDEWTDRQEKELRELPAEDVLILEKPFKAMELRAAVSTLTGELAARA